MDLATSELLAQRNTFHELPSLLMMEKGMKLSGLKNLNLTFLSFGGHLPVHCRRNNQVSRSSFPGKVNPTYYLCMISTGIDFH